MRGVHLLGLLLLYSAFVSADEIKLYACVRNGETTLESVRSNDCDNLTVYKYTREKEDPNKASRIRPEEQRYLDANQKNQPSAASEIRRYENVDDRVGWAVAEDYNDTAHDKCAFYTAKLNSLYALIGVTANDIRLGSTTVPGIERDDIREQQLHSAINYTRGQINYYCK